MQFDVIVIGAGAAGMMSAATAGARGRSVLLIDHAAKLAEKIRISGGGRCNFTNRDLKPDNFLSDNPHFCRSALSRYTPQHFIALADSHGITHHEKALGQLFCDDSSQQIIDMLKAECDSAGVTWQRPSAVLGVAHDDAGGFSVNTDQGEHTAASLVIATGGLTVPKIGSTPFGYRVAEQFGLKVVPPRPALVPLALDPAWLARFGDLSGASFDSIASCAGPKFREQTLLTHRGLSGPAIDRTQPAQRRTDAGADESQFRQRRIADAIRSEFFEQAFRCGIGAAVTSDVLTHQEHARVSEHRLAQTLAHGFAIAHAAHG